MVGLRAGEDSRWNYLPDSLLAARSPLSTCKHQRVYKYVDME
jgi:hypothetical protein